MFEEEADRYNDVMSDVATGEQRGGEVRRSGGTRNGTFLRDWNFWQGSLLSAQDSAFLRNSDAQEMNSHSVYRLKRSLRFFSPRNLIFYICICFVPSWSSTQRGEYG